MPQTYGAWIFSLFLASVFITFTLFFLRPKTIPERKSFGFVGSYFIVIFIEMFGIPLSIYFLYYLGYKQVLKTDLLYRISPILILSGPQRPHYVWLAIMIFHGLTLLIGMVLIILGWKQIYSKNNINKLVTNGIYKYSRHPQYIGILVISFGWLVQWPTFFGLVMWPILVLIYRWLALKEEAYLALKFKKEFIAYKNKTRSLL